MKLNVGSHQKKIEGYVNLDVMEIPGVDIVHDATKPPYKGVDGQQMAEGSVEEILSQEFLEHIPFRLCRTVLREWHRILKPGGKVVIQVPNAESMCRIIDQQCECVPRKAEKMEDYQADPDCELCLGKGLIHPERWKYAFTGAQKHPYDAHLNIFGPKDMYEELVMTGFTDIVDHSNLYKVIVEARKPND